VTVTGEYNLGDGAGNQQVGGTVVFTKKEQVGLIFRRSASVGTFTGDMVVSIQETTLGLPNGTIVASKPYTNAEWEALSTTEDTVALFNFTPVIGNTYAFIFTPSTQDASNYARIKANSGTPNLRVRYNGSVWDATNGSPYFKTLYSKNTTNFTVSTDTESLTVTAPTTDGWANGTVIDTTDGTYGITPLTLAPGANDVYYSSNGPATADGEVDPSLQATVSGTYWN
jgi:hypothetical protein